MATQGGGVRFEGATTAVGSALTPSNHRSLEIETGNVVKLTDGRIITDAVYLRAGDDLVLRTADGQTLVVEDYFALADRPMLVSDDGGRMTPDMVDAFTLNHQPDAVAQASEALAVGAIATVVVLEGTATVTRADGTVEELSEDTPIYQNDIVESGPDSAVRLLFVDDTVFAIGPAARLVIDEFVFDALEGSGVSAVSILKGMFTFVSGRIADGDPTDVVLTTPVAVIGIRGTACACDIQPPGASSTCTVLEPTISLTNDGGQVILDQRYATSMIPDFNTSPSEPEIITDEEARETYGPVQRIFPDVFAPDGDGGEETDGDSSVIPEAGPGSGAAGGPPPSDGGTSQFTFFESQARSDGGAGAQGPNDHGVNPGNPGDHEVNPGGATHGEDGSGSDAEGGAGGAGGAGEDTGGGAGQDTGPGGGEETIGGGGEETTGGGDLTLIGGPGDDSLVGGAGNDSIFGAGGNDTLDGGAGNDTLVGDTGNDSVIGGAGNDSIVAGSGEGDDTYHGGGDSDTLDYSSAIAGLIIDLANGTTQGGEEIGDDVFDGIEHVIAGSGDDVFVYAPGYSSLDGGPGSDSLRPPPGSTIDLRAGQAPALSGIEAVDLADDDADSLVIDGAGLVAMVGVGGTLTVFGTEDDSVDAGPGWTSLGLTQIGEATYQSYVQGGARMLVQSGIDQSAIGSTALDVAISDGAPNPQTEGPGATITFTVSLPAPAGSPVTVDFTTVDGTAIAGSDYVAQSGTLTFAAGETSKQVVVAVLDDAVFENAESFTVEISDAVFDPAGFAAPLSIDDGSGTGTIVETALPVLSINDVTVEEPPFAPAGGGQGGGEGGPIGIAQAAAFAVNPSNDGTALVNNILGSGVALAGPVTYVGSATSSGFFEGGLAAGIGIESGIILTSGNAADAVGPNLLDSTTGLVGTGGDADLDALIPQTTFDTSSLEFTFTTDGGDLFFNFVFASEEYNEFANTNVNDVFAMFLDGANVAFIPGTTTPVSINTVNGGNPFGTNASNPDLFNNNDLTDGGPFFNIEYDGFTDVFTASVVGLAPGEHTMKIAIADAGDTSFDSAVFIQASSFSDAPPVPEEPGVGTAVFTVTLSGPSAETVTVDYMTVDGTAVTTGEIAPGTFDYEPTSGTLTFLPGETAKTIEVPVYGDLAVEATELFTVELRDPVNADIGDFTGIGTILDTPPALAAAFAIKVRDETETDVVLDQSAAITEENDANDTGTVRISLDLGEAALVGGNTASVTVTMTGDAEDADFTAPVIQSIATAAGLAGIATSGQTATSVTLTWGEGDPLFFDAGLMSFDDQLTDGPETLTLTLSAPAIGDGIAAIAAGMGAADLTVTDTDTAPPVVDLNGIDQEGTGFDAGTFTEGDAPRAAVDLDATITDADSANLLSLTVTLTNPLDGAAETLAADNTGTAIAVNYVSETGVLTLSGLDSVANYQQVLRTLTYHNGSENPDPTQRVLEVQAEDDQNQLSNVAVATIAVLAVNDPPVAVDDAYAADEDTVLNVNAANGVIDNPATSDSDPDGDMLSVSAFDALSALGATVVVQADGSFTYDPTGAEALQLLGAGEDTVDSFTYTVDDGNEGQDTATVEITVSGAGESPTGGDDTVFGTNGNDTLDGLAGDDLLIGGPGDDLYLFEAGNSDDTITDSAGDDTVRIANAILWQAGRAGDDLVLTYHEYGVATDHSVTITDHFAGTGFAVETLEMPFVLVRPDSTYAATLATAPAGTAGNDVIVGTAAGETIAGGDGFDWIDAGAGDDSLTGGIGDTYFVGGPGDDTIDGMSETNGPQYETDFDAVDYRSAGSAVTVDLGVKGGRDLDYASVAPGSADDGDGGTDTLSNVEVVIGSAFDDRLTSSSGGWFEPLHGLAGNDTLVGGEGTGASAVYFFSPAGVHVDLAAGFADDGHGTTDLLVNITHMEGSRYDDMLLGKDGPQFIVPGEGNDTIDGRGSDDGDIVSYESLRSFIVADMSNPVDTVTKTTDNGVFTDDLSNIERIRGTHSDDTIVGAVDHPFYWEWIRGMAGDDSLDGGEDSGGGGGFDVLDFEEAPGAVNVSLATSIVTNDGFGGQDTISGFDGVSGSKHDDTIIGGLVGGSADDGFQWFQGGAGNDSIVGDATVDTILEYFGSPNGIVADFGTGVIQDGWGFTDTVANIDHINGSDSGDDLVTGDGNDNGFTGNGGDDTFNGGAGNDAFTTNLYDLGQDLFDDSAGASDTVGIVGALLNLERSGDDLLVRHGNTLDNVITVVDQFNTETDGVEQLSRLGPFLFYSLPQDLTATGGNDALVAPAGGATIDGGNGDDWVNGGSGGDSLTGGAGSDVVVGMAGSDTMEGGSSDDRYQVFAGNGADTITDSSGTGDTIAFYVPGVTAARSGGDLVFRYGDNPDADVVTVLGQFTAEVTPLELVDIIAIDDFNTTFGLYQIASGQTPTAGNDFVVGAQHTNNSLTGGDGDDWLNGVSPGDGGGNDTLDGGAGNDILVGMDGNDLYLFDGDDIDPDFGNFEFASEFSVGGGDDTIQIDNALPWTIYRDEIVGQDLVISYGFGVVASVVIVDHFGGSGSEIETLAMPVLGFTGNLLTGLAGTAQNDVIVGTGATETIVGGMGDDWLFGGAGVAGGPTGGDDSLSGGDGNDLVVGSWYGDSTLDGGANDDFLSGVWGDDSILGGTGNDTLEGDGGSDTLDGGADFDYISFEFTDGFGPNFAVSIDMAAGQAIDFQGNTDVFSNIEGAIGSIQADVIIGDALANTLVGHAGGDTMTGGGGGDIFWWRGQAEIDLDFDNLVDGVDQVIDFSGSGVGGADGDALQITDLLADIAGGEFFIGDYFNAVVNGGDNTKVDLQVDFFGTGGTETAWQTFAQFSSGDGLSGQDLLDDVLNNSDIAA